MTAMQMEACRAGTNGEGSALRTSCQRTAPAWQRLGAALSEVGRRFDEWQRRARSRHELMALGDDVLKDMGLGRSEAYREYSKPFWRG
ncbi:MAG: DUF1127 domain-containing protein [Alphaproteobacteria bacterium]|nr:DUF1127 domain-containing protein [Alphaproteobacteria bacterium]